MARDPGSKTGTMHTRYGSLQYGRQPRRTLGIRILFRLSLLIAVSFLLMVFIEFPVPPFPVFWKYSPAEVPGLIGTFAMGPLAGLIIQIGKCALYFLSGKGEPIGVSANLLANGIWMLTAGFLYRRWHDRLGAVLAMGIGAITSLAVMVPANVFLFIPLYGIPRETAIALVLPMIGFNLVKAVITGLIVFVLYKRVRRLL